MWKFALYLSALAVVLSDKGLLGSDSKHLQESDILRLLPNHGKDLFVKKDMQDLALKLVSADKYQDIINVYVDIILQNLTLSVDPVTLKDIRREFEKDIGFITFRGKMALTDGTMQGVAAVKRAGDAILSLHNDTLNLHMTLIFSQLEFTYNYSAAFMELTSSGYVDGKILPSKITADVQISLTAVEAKLVNFELDEMGDVYMQLEGNNVPEWLVYVLIWVIRRFAQLDLENEAHDFIQKGTVALIELYNSIISS